MTQNQEAVPPSRDIMNQKTQERRVLKAEFGKLRRHMQVNGPPTTTFTTGAPLDVEESSSNSSKGNDDDDLDELRNLIDEPLTKDEIDTLEVDRAKPFKGLSEVENDHYTWLETRIQIVVKSLQALQEELDTTNAKWNSLSDFEVNEEKLDELLIDDGKISALGESVAELEGELTLFKRDHDKLADKIAKYKESAELAEAKVKAELRKEQEARDLAKRPIINGIVINKLNTIEEEFDKEFADSDRITIAKPPSTTDSIKNTRDRMNQARMQRGEYSDTTQILERNSY